MQNLSASAGIIFYFMVSMRQYVYFSEMFACAYRCIYGLLYKLFNQTLHYFTHGWGKKNFEMRASEFYRLNVGHMLARCGNLAQIHAKNVHLFQCNHVFVFNDKLNFCAEIIVCH